MKEKKAGESMLLPEQFLTVMNKNFGSAWRESDALRAVHKGDWEPAVFLPLTYWRDICCSLYKTKSLDPVQATLVQKLAAAGAWRPAQDIVRFDPDVARALMDTPLEGGIPSDVLLRLPAWCVWFDVAVEAHMRWDGFFAYLNEKDRCMELCLHFLAYGEDMPLAIRIGDWSIEEGCLQPLREGAKLAQVQGMEAFVTGDGFMQGVKQALSLILYVCAYGLVEKPGSQASKINYPVPKKVKTGWRIFPPDQPKIHLLGESIGTQIRHASRSTEHSGSHASKRPHIRRAHWHTYRVGQGRQDFELKWLSPIAVAMREEI